jgi:transcriptional antiterminator RfaH
MDSIMPLTAQPQTDLNASDASLNWYLLHTKPREEARALLNLEQQDYPCYCPMISTEKQRRGKVKVISESMFSRYLFIQLDASPNGKGWHSIRSTPGVSGLVMFGTEYAKIDEQVIQCLRTRESTSKL